MSYRVKEVSSEVPLVSKPFLAVTYPQERHDEPIINSSLLILQDLDNDTFWNRIKSKFGYNPPEYNIVVYQDISVEERAGFFLYEGSDLAITKEAFLKLQGTLTPLLREGTVTLTEDLLKEIILPKPLDEKSMIIRLVNYIEAHPDAHPEWYMIINLLEPEPEEDTEKPSDHSSSPETVTPPPKAAKMSESPEIIEDIVSFFSSVIDQIVDIFSFGSDNDASCDKKISQKIWEAFQAQFKSKSSAASSVFREKILSLFHAFSSSENINKRPLMTAIEKNFIECALSLLLAGSNPNLQQEKTLLTPLHVAVANDKPVMVKLLLAFNADPTILNADGKTPLDLAVESKEKNARSIFTFLDVAKTHQAKTRDYFASHSTPPTPKNSSDTFLISLDGGGIRAFNICQALIAIQNRMEQLNANCNQLMSYFDYISGTSSGGIAGLVLSYTNHDVYTGRYLVYKIIADVFDKDKSKRGKLMDSYLQSLFGEEKVMADLDPPQRMIVTGTLANADPNRLHLMTSYGESRDGQLGPNERKVWEAGRITSAAPYYFPCFQDKFLDGGLMANNPTLDAMTEIIEQSKTSVKFGCVLSLGTGYMYPPQHVKHVDTFVPLFSFNALTRIPNAFKGLISLFDHFIAQVTQSDGQEVQRAKAWCNNSGWPYFRLSPPLFEAIDPTSADREAVIHMLYNTQMHLLYIPDQIDNIAKAILSK